MKDKTGRNITYMRISVTDRCNFRCVYCMPEEGIPWQGHHEIMRYEEIITSIKAAAQFGVNKIRLTGGEPLVRPGIVDLVKMIRDIPEIKDISLTTNGYLLSKYAKGLKEAGLDRVNISLDTLKPDLFKRIVRSGDLQTVLDGIQAAEDAGLAPIKLNIVSMRGVNDEEFTDFARLTIEKDWHVRFIELMPVKNDVSWGPGFPKYEDAYISTHEIKERLSDMNLQVVKNAGHKGPAKLYQAEGAKGLLGFISPIDDLHFCSTCNRIRLTADGFIRPCLMSEAEYPLLSVIRAGGDVEEAIRIAILKKPKRHHLLEHITPHDRSMMQIGG